MEFRLALRRQTYLSEVLILLKFVLRVVPIPLTAGAVASLVIVGWAVVLAIAFLSAR
jgi:hypothetical protein